MMESLFVFLNSFLLNVRIYIIPTKSSRWFTKNVMTFIRSLIGTLSPILTVRLNDVCTFTEC